MQKKYLVAFDGSPSSLEALELAKHQALLRGSHVLLVTSMLGGSKEKPETISEANFTLEEAGSALKASGVSCETHQLVRGLSPGEDIVKFAADNAVDFIFIGVEKKSRTQKILLGSTAQYVILKAGCPVVTVKSKPAP
ncbi:MAG: universal stress protein [Desulfobacterales bacterium]|jgi:nucleotide-binding universal stress UspA family protein